VRPPPAGPSSTPSHTSPSVGSARSSAVSKLAKERFAFVTYLPMVRAARSIISPPTVRPCRRATPRACLLAGRHFDSPATYRSRRDPLRIGSISGFQRQQVTYNATALTTYFSPRQGTLVIKGRALKDSVAKWWLLKSRGVADQTRPARATAVRAPAARCMATRPRSRRSAAGGRGAVFEVVPEAPGPDGRGQDLATAFPSCIACGAVRFAPAPRSRGPPEKLTEPGWASRVMPDASRFRRRAGSPRPIQRCPSWTGRAWWSTALTVVCS